MTELLNFVYFVVGLLVGLLGLWMSHMDFLHQEKVKFTEIRDNLTGIHKDLASVLGNTSYIANGREEIRDNITGIQKDLVSLSVATSEIAKRREEIMFDIIIKSKGTVSSNINLAEVSQERQASGFFATGATLNLLNVEKLPFTDLASSMTSGAQDIIQKVKQLAEDKTDIFPVDLGSGNVWIPPNLYFLALLLTYKTRVRQVVFVETREQEQSFVGMCFPDKLLQALSNTFPIYGVATGKSKQLVPGLTGIGSEWFTTLADLVKNAGLERDDYSHKKGLTSASLPTFVSGSLNRLQIEWNGSLSEQDYRLIISSTYPFVAAVRNGQFEFLIDQARVTLRITQAFIEGNSERRKPNDLKVSA